MNKRKKHFEKLRAEDKIRKPPTKAQKRNQMSTYLKNMGRYQHIKEGSAEKATATSSRKKSLGKKRAVKEQQQESPKRQKLEEDKETGEHEEVEADDTDELKKHISKRYSSMIRLLQGIDREDLQTLWKLVKIKHGDTRPEDEHERVLRGDLKVMFEPDIRSDVWRNLQRYKVTIWKLFDSCGVHFVRFRNVHIFMLVEKRYPSHQLQSQICLARNFKLITGIRYAIDYSSLW
ncbi:hypothetical protein Tco_0854386 [Tanacetum coccineum]